MSSRDKFISQCVAQTPCVGWGTSNCKMDDVLKQCMTCKRTLGEIAEWESMPFDKREDVCKELLDR
mgnify:FL=1